MNDIRIDPQWIVIGVASVDAGGTTVYLAYGAYRRRSRRKGLLARLERIGYAAAHQVLVPDGMGGYIHIDHILLTPRGVLVLDTRRVARADLRRRSNERLDGHGARPRFTFDNPQPALYDRIAAVKALWATFRWKAAAVLQSRRFTKGKPKYVIMLDGIEVGVPGRRPRPDGFP